MCYTYRKFMDSNFSSKVNTILLMDKIKQLLHNKM